MGWGSRDRAACDRDRRAHRAALLGADAREAGERGARARGVVRDDQGPHALCRGVPEQQGGDDLCAWSEQDDHRRDQALHPRRPLHRAQPRARQPHRVRRRRCRDLVQSRHHGIGQDRDRHRPVRHALLRRRARDHPDGAGGEQRDVRHRRSGCGEAEACRGEEPVARGGLQADGHQRHETAARDRDPAREEAAAAPRYPGRQDDPQDR
mmetsp:Transcript_31433/g.74144  ORF Transcript_31433/g.74144 Transcript_31433/m.74144 type:complete len:209 (+) Transcript_31433:1165-1791(+)